MSALTPLVLRTVLSLCLNFYIARLAIQYLSVEIYGLYGVIYSIVVISAFFATSLEMVSQRFLNRTNESSQYSTIINLLWATVIVLAWSIASISIVSYFILEYILFEMSQSFIGINQIILLSAINFVAINLCIPLMAYLVVKKYFFLYSSVTILDLILKVLLLILVNPNTIQDFMYIVLFSTLISRSLLLIICQKKLKGQNKGRFQDVKIIQKILQQVFWTSIGSLASTVNNQVFNIMIGRFFGLEVAAARNLSQQVFVAMQQFINNIQLLFNNKIFQVGINKKDLHLDDILKYNVIFLQFISGSIIIFFIFDIKFFLDIWLTVIPQYLEQFVFLCMLEIYILTLSIPLIIAIQSSGIIKQYQICVGTVMLMNLPICYLLIMQFYNPIYIYLSNVLFGIITLGLRISFSVKLLSVKYLQYIIKGILPAVFSLCVSIVIKMLLITAFGQSIWIILSCMIFYIFSFILIAFNQTDRSKYRSLLTKWV